MLHKPLFFRPIVIRNIGSSVFILFLIGFFHVLQAQCTGNLIANPSFETNDFTSWTRFNPNSQDGTYTDAFTNKDGTYYAVVSPDGNTSLNYMYQDIPISAGYTLNLSVYGAVHDTAVDHQFKLIFYDASNTEISQQNVQVDHDIDGNDTLTLYTLSGVAPAGTVKVRVEGYADGFWSGNGGVGLKSDGWCLTATAPFVCPGNLLANPSFELGFTAPNTTQTPPQGWTGGISENPTTPFASLPDGSAFGYTQQSSPNLCQTVPTTPGATIDLSFYAGVHEVHGQTISLQYMNGTTPIGTPQTHTITHIFGTTFGGPYTLSLTAAPVGTTGVRVCANGDPATAGFAGYAKMDAVCLQETPAVCTQPTFTINAVQPTCGTPTGTITIGTITGPDTYTFNYDDMATYVTGVLGANGAASNGATVASGLSAGTYTVQLFKSTDNTCISNPNQTITLNAATGCGGGGQPDLELTKAADKSTVVSGNTITYTITLKNIGTASATGVKVKDSIPAGLTYVSSVPSQGTYTNTTGIWDVGTVAIGATLTLTITVTVN